MAPLQQGLSLDRATCDISFATIGFDLARMAREGFPPFYLNDVQLGNASTHVVTAIPLEPSSLIWILFTGKDRIAAGHGTMTIWNPPAVFPLLKRES